VKNKNENIENFIRENKNKFGGYRPSDAHLEKFLYKLNTRIGNLISIVPHLLKVAVATVIIFTVSFTVWNSYIRKDRNDITLKNKISLFIDKLKS
jgi:hypothetical protein